MQKKRSMELITCNPDNFDHQLIKNKYMRIITTVIVVGIYFVLNIIKVRLSRLHNESISILGFNLMYSGIVAMISQIQVLISVFLVTLLHKAGYIIDWIITAIALAISLSGVFIVKNNVALQGIFPQILTMLVVIVIYQYIKLSDKKFKEVNQLAYYDPLTSLPNRRMIIERIDSLIMNYDKEKESFSVIFIDLDNFKKINDSAGHLVGDQVLSEIAQRWGKKIHNEDLLGRLGGDEFAILIQRPLSQQEILSYIEEFREVLKQPVFYKHREFYIKASFGISMFPDDGDSSELLLKYADVAMYEAKASKGGRIQFFNRELEDNFQHIVLIEAYLQQVLARKELAIVFQPQYEGKDNNLRGFEALARWNSKELGKVSPGEFIPIAEENGMIISMGEWILRESCTICKQWMDTCHKKFKLSVNVSAVQLLDSGFLDMVENVLQETGFDPECLEMEVTESMFISSMESAISALTKMQEKKIKIALDDFGTGYASLSYLESLPIDTIKIDKSFIDKISTERKPQALVKSLIGVSHEFGLKVVAEGVEEQAQLDILREVQCDYIQGYLLGKPLEEKAAFMIVKNSCI